MIIHIKTIDDTTFDLTVRISESIESVKAKIEEQENITKDEQILIFKGVHLKDCQTLAECGIGNKDTIDLVL